MKLHLPSALRGALLACFALACTAPAWAATDVVIDSSDALLIKTVGEYTLVPGSDAIAQGITIDKISLKDTTTLNIGSDSSKFTAIAIENLLVNDGKDLVVNIAAGTTVYLDNVNFNGKVKYNLGEGATLVISANDCTKGCISGNGNVLFTGGIINATQVNDPNWFTTDTYPGSAAALEIDKWSVYYEASGSNINFNLAPDAVVHINASNGTGGNVQYAPDGFYPLDWLGSGGIEQIPKDSPSVIIDTEEEVYRRDNETGKEWVLHKDISVQELQAGKHTTAGYRLGDDSDSEWASLQSDDALLFAGATLTSTASTTVNGAILVAGTNKVKLDVSAGKTLTFTQGDGALSNGNGLEISGGKGSKVVLQNVATAAPEGIVFLSENTNLGIAGPDTLTLDANKNTFLATTGLSKEDGGTLTYIAKDNDTIGSLSNSKGTINFGTGVTKLTAGSLTANKLDIGTQGTTIKATQVTAGTLNIDDSMNYIVTLDTKQLTSSNTVSVGSYSHLLTTTTKATNLELESGALMTADTLTATGTLTVGTASGRENRYGLVIGNVDIARSDSGSLDTAKGTLTIYGNGDSATLTNVTANAGGLTATSVDAASITVAASPARAAAPTLTLGTVSDTVITAKQDISISNSSFENSTVNVTGNLSLRGTTHGASSSLSATTMSFDGSLRKEGKYTLVDGGATILGGGKLSVGGTDYSVTSEPQSVTILGSADSSNMTITAIYADLTGPDKKGPTTATQNPKDPAAPILLTSSTGTITAAGGYFFDYLTEPGMVPYLHFGGNSVSFILADESNRIINELKTSDNSTSAVDALTAYGMGREDDGTVLFELFNYLRDTSRADIEKRQAALDAVVSGSHTMMADSQRRSVHNTIDSLRNRIIQMGSVYDTEPDTYIHAWIAAEGNNDEVDQDGAYAGYEYQTWGGSVGVHADVGNFSFGAAVSAAYGDLTSTSADHAEGDHDAVSLSAFVRHQAGRWTQMGILSLGRNEVEMQRTIHAEKNPGKGDNMSYTGDGDASGHTITGYYEAGYTISLNDENTQLIQPIVSIMLTSARMGEYHETGTIGNAGVCTPTEDYFYGTVGIGARYQIVLGTTSVDRISFAEVRAKLVQDFGDKTNETSAYFNGLHNQSFTLRGADVGRTGFQLGAGISVPTNVYTTLFADVDADFRSGATSVSGSVGIRLEF